MTITPTNEEIVMAEDDFIISKTDTKGKITYGNRSFIEYSGYEEEELLGQPHNIIRHPDMPRAVYRFMWQTLQAEQEFFGYVKNLHKDGKFYWVFANVTPSYDQNNKVIGYYSVRRKPHPKHVEAFSSLYKEMIAVEKQSSNSQESMDASTQLLVNALGGKEYNEFVIAA